MRGRTRPTLTLTGVFLESGVQGENSTRGSFEAGGDRERSRPGQKLEPNVRQSSLS